MSNYHDTLNKIEQWTIIDVNSPTTRGKILQQIEKDKLNPLQFNMEFYNQYKGKYSLLGQTNLEIVELSKPWRISLTIIKAICKFKRGLKKKSLT